MKRIPTPESGVLRACLDILGYLKICHERRNTGAMKDGKRFVRFSRKGTADIFATPRLPIRDNAPTPCWIECKSDVGQQTKEQREFQKEVMAAGHYYLLVRKPEDLLGWLNAHRVTVMSAQSVVDEMQQ